MTTHADLVAAVDTAWSARLTIAAHLDTLAAILNLHTPSVTDDRMCAECPLQSWPCDSVGIVADALRKMGAL